MRCHFQKRVVFDSYFSGLYSALTRIQRLRTALTVAIKRRSPSHRQCAQSMQIRVFSSQSPLMRGLEHD